MTRPWDWISHDPDFLCLRKSAEFTGFLNAQQLRDYPMSDAVPATYHQLELMPVSLPGQVASSA